MKNEKGFPRPNLPLDGKNTPLPYVGGDYPEHDQWARVDRERSYEVEVDRLCLVCGLDLPDDYVFMLVGSTQYSTTASIGLFGDGLPSPTWAHPKCGLIASKFCPHLKWAQYPACTQDEQPLTHEELSELARKSDKPQKALQEVNK